MAGKRRVFLLPVLAREVRSVPSSENEITRTTTAATPSMEPTGIPISSLPVADTPSNSDVVPGVQSGTTKKYSLANLFSWILGQITPAGIGAIPTSRMVNNKALSQDITLTASDVGARVDTWMPSASDVGAQPTITANGILKGDGQGGVSAAVAGTDYGTYSKPSGGIPASDLASGVIPAVPSAYTSNPEMDGTASPGSSGAWAKGDHVHPSDTSKANQTQLAYVETGTTASRAYSVGEYFCWNGLLYRARTAISSGASFTPGTNCEVYTVSRIGIIGSYVSSFTFDGLTDTGQYEITFYFKNGERRILQIFDSGSPKLRLNAYNGSSWSTKWTIT